MKKLNFLNDANNSKFVMRKWNIVNDNSKANYEAGNKITYNTEVLKSNLCDYNDAYILLTFYLTYGNVAWCSTSMNKTKKLFGKQKQVIKIIPVADIHANLNSDEKMKRFDILNIYKLNLYQILNIMF